MQTHRPKQATRRPDDHAWHQTNVGAGLPAMRTPRCIGHTRATLSQASQPPHWLAFLQCKRLTARCRSGRTPRHR
ncbi:hypothetical protein C1Y30_29820 [Pseudomonas sp. GW704-F3]|nr:hypothetical protein C1Y30_29820 [Pseudomonas sp. GW704-F3]PMU87847.1 hypothetical protein C1Y28_29750 [Pseudomonas sp. GW704-F5]PMU98243.1 hypothetical protein C1Y29_29165 [Pseudomonas sp. MPBD4-3]PMV18982.1 hypothetical protein C1Y27_30100 [Pseudomonas sp. GW704-F2]